MKITTLVCFLLVASGLRVQTCPYYFPLQNSLKYEMTSYDEKGRQTNRAAYQLGELRNTLSGQRANVHADFFDNKNKFYNALDYDVQCSAGSILMDMRAFLPVASTEALRDLYAVMEGNSLRLPHTMQVGDTLNNGSLFIDVFMNKRSTTNLMRMKMEVTDRVVTGKETITTPLGTFECLKITYHVKFTTISIPQHSNVVEWYNKEYGLVKSETYRMNGKLNGYTLLTKVEKP